MGQHRQVLDEIGGLLAHMDELPSQAGRDEGAAAWNIREAILDAGRSSALALGELQEALDFNQAVLASMRARGVSAWELAYARYNDTEPLINLGRLNDAEQLLNECQQVFEDSNDLDQLGNIFGARARLEAARGNPAGAQAFSKTGLRYHYLRLDPEDIGAGHRNLANYLREDGSDAAAQRAHRLAAALIYQLTGMTDRLSRTSAALASELRQAGQERLPKTVPEVIAVAEQTEGVKLGELIAALAPDPGEAAAALAQILDTAASMPADQEADIQEHLRRWEPVIADMVAAAGGVRDAAAKLGPFLDEAAGSQDWAALAAVLRRILGGERGEQLLEGLDPVDTAIAGQVLARLDR